MSPFLASTSLTFTPCHSYPVLISLVALSFLLRLCLELYLADAFSLFIFLCHHFFPLGFSLLLFDSSLSSEGFFGCHYGEDHLCLQCPGVSLHCCFPHGPSCRCGSPQRCRMGPSGMSPHWHGCSQPQPLWLPKPEVGMISVKGICSSRLLQSGFLYCSLENQFAITKIKEENWKYLHVT